MTNTSKNKWNNFSKYDLELLRLINEITHKNHCPYFLIGAKARDVLLEHFGKNEAQRATLDTDIVISCKNWDAFYKIKNGFINNGAFIADDKHEHRVISKYGVLDILPFGNIGKEGPNIKWPPDYDIEFSLIGFDDAYRNAMDININDITIKITSPIGFALLKLLAWLSRKTQKDASDFAYFISNYLDLGNQDRFYEEHNDLLAGNFDYTLSGCRLLGRDLKNLSLETKLRLKEFFGNEYLTDQLYAFGQIHLQSTHKLIQHISSLITRSYLCRTRNNIGTKFLSDIRPAVYRNRSFANRTNYPAINFNIDGISTIVC